MTDSHNTNKVLDVSGLDVRFGKRAVLDSVDLTLARGETAFLLGANGAGKSTLLRAVLGLAPITRGSVHIGGFDARRHVHEARARVGYVPDRADAPSWMSPQVFFDFLAPHHATWSATRAAALLEQFDVDCNQPFAELSRGQSTLVMLAAALAHGPQLVLLDEPFAHLDPGARVCVQRGLLEHVDWENGACLVATHDLDVVARLAGRVLVLEGGRVATRIETDTPDAPLPARRHDLEALFAREN